MTTLDLLRHLRERRIEVRSVGGAICLEGPVELLTSELRTEVASRKPEMLAVLEGRWLHAAAALMQRSVAALGEDTFWELDEAYQRGVADQVAGGAGQDAAHRVAYEALARGIDAHAPSRSVAA